MTLAARFAMTSASPGDSTALPAADPLWRLPMSAFHWTRVESSSGSEPISGVTAGDSLSFEGPGELHLTTIDFAGRRVSDAAAGPFHDDAVVKLSSGVNAGAPHRTTLLELAEAWNTIKNVAITAIDTEALTLRNFVDVRVALEGDQDRVIRLDNAKRGLVMTEGGADQVTIAYASNEYTWSNMFRIATGNGNDTVRISPQAEADLPQAIGSVVFNAHREQTSARVDLGAGHDTIETQGCSGLILGGAGNDTIRFAGGNMTVHGGAGRDTIIAARDPAATAPSVSTVDGGAGRDTIQVLDGLQADNFHVTIAVHKNETGHSIGTADEVRVGSPSADGGFDLGNLSKLSFEFHGYSAGSTAELIHRGVHTLLRVQDAGDGDLDVIKLVGQPIATLAELDIQFIGT